jgi:hypothetical protein
MLRQITSGMISCLTGREREMERGRERYPYTNAFIAISSNRQDAKHMRKTGNHLKLNGISNLH